MRPFLVALGWVLVALIAYLSLTPAPPSFEMGFEQGDKLEHFLAYGSLMLWFSQLYVRTPVRAAYALGFVALGIALEFIQPQFGRDFELADMAADALGVALGWAGALALKLRLPA